MNRKSLAPLIFGAPMLLALALPGDKVAFAPEDDVSVSKTLRLKLEFTLDDLYMNVMGQEITPEMMGADMSEPFSADMLVSVSETYVKSSGGRPVDLLRTFDGLSLEMAGGGETEEVDDFTELEGETVQFKWEEEEGDYAVTYHESEGDEELLQWLSEDMDLRVLLPEDDVSEGDTWQVSAEELYVLFFPGGIVSAPSGDEADEMATVQEEIMSQFEGVFEDFTVDCKYQGTRDGMGVIAFEYDGEAAIDLAGMIQTLAEMQGEGPDIEDLAFDLELSLKGEGELLWDLEAGYAHSFEMSSEVGVVVDGEMSMSMEGQTFEATVSAEMSGSGSWEMEVE